MLLNDALIGALATLIVGVLGLLQWIISSRVRARGRDKELFDWGGSVIDLMAAIETLAAESGPGDRAQAFKAKARAFAANASALVDKGRLFFPNVQTRAFEAVKLKGKDKAGGEGAYRGFRVKILDEVVRAYVIAGHLAAYGPPRDGVLRERMRASRRRFVSHLQKEMSKSLKRSSAEKSGAPVPDDPYSWTE
jgi:hypothetical protein